MNVSLLNAIKQFLKVLESENLETNLFTRNKITKLSSMSESVRKHLENGEDFEYDLDLIETA